MKRPRGLNTKAQGQFKGEFQDPPSKAKPAKGSLAHSILVGDQATLTALGLSKDEAKKRLNEFWTDLKVNDWHMERWYRSIFIRGDIHRGEDSSG